jgi:hypothetical protein
MKKLAFIRRHGVAFAALFLVLGGTSYAAATTAGFISRGGVITACANKHSGRVRLVSSATRCHHGEQKVSWNQKGVAGQTGAAGKTGATGPTGPTGAAGLNGSSAGLNDFNDGPVILSTSGEQTVATMANVPAGNYILTAKAEVSNGATPLFVDCFLRAGGDFDESRAELAASGAAGSVETLPFTLSHVFAATGTVTLTCNSFGATANVLNAKISAVQVQSLTRTSG